MSLTRHVAALPEPLHSLYRIDRVLAVGAYGVVYEVRSKATEEAYALKVVEKEPMRIRAMMPQLEREVALLKAHASSPHVVTLLEDLQTPTHFFLRFDLYGESMEEMIQRTGSMSEEEAFRWFHQLCLGIQELHGSKTIHRDLKPSNLLIDDKGGLHICDFGWACAEEDRLSGACGTPAYNPPECMVNATVLHTRKIDVYGSGACLQHMLLGRVPQGPVDFPSGHSDESRDLVEKLLQRDPEERPEIEDVFSHRLVGGRTSVVSKIYSAVAGFSNFIRVSASNRTFRFNSKTEERSRLMSAALSEISDDGITESKARAIRTCKVVC